MNFPKYVLISHYLCPFVQRSAIAMSEKGVPFERRNVDLANKPKWFLKLSPLGKVPLLVVDDDIVLFESAVIAEYIDTVTPGTLLSLDPLTRARQRAWIEFATATIANIGDLYNAENMSNYQQALDKLMEKWQKLERNLGDGRWFSGDEFSLVDAAFAPALRYFDVFEQLIDTDFFPDVPKLTRWRQNLAQRVSVRQAVSESYPKQLATFIARRDSLLGNHAKSSLGIEFAA